MVCETQASRQFCRAAPGCVHRHRCRVALGGAQRFRVTAVLHQGRLGGVPRSLRLSSGSASRPLPQTFVGLSEVEVETAGSQRVAHPWNHLSVVEWLCQEVIRTQHKSAVASGPAGTSASIPSFCATGCRTAGVVVGERIRAAPVKAEEIHRSLCLEIYSNRYAKSPSQCAVRQPYIGRARPV